MKLILATALLSSIALGTLAAEDECHQYYKGEIGMELCVETETEVVEGRNIALISGSLSNIGNANMCNITFDVLNLDEALDYSPTYLPRVPDAFEPKEVVKFSARVPIDEESHVAPYADVWSSFYECSEAEMRSFREKKDLVIAQTPIEEEVEEIEVEKEVSKIVTETPIKDSPVEESKEEEEAEEVVKITETITERPVKDSSVEGEKTVVEEENKGTTIQTPSGESANFDELITPETMCFMGCYEAVVERNGGSEDNIEVCPALEYILSEDCHTCETMIVEASKLKCIQLGCSELQCNINGEIRVSSANSNSFTVLSFILSTMFATIMFFSI